MLITEILWEYFYSREDIKDHNDVTEDNALLIEAMQSMLAMEEEKEESQEKELKLLKYKKSVIVRPCPQSFNTAQKRLYLAKYIRKIPPLRKTI